MDIYPEPCDPHWSGSLVMNALRSTTLALQKDLPYEMSSSSPGWTPSCENKQYSRGGDAGLSRLGFVVAYTEGRGATCGFIYIPGGGGIAVREEQLLLFRLDPLLRTNKTCELYDV